MDAEIKGNFMMCSVPESNKNCCFSNSIILQQALNEAEQCVKCVTRICALGNKADSIRDC